MKNIVIIGAGGLGREVAQLIVEINQNKEEWLLLGFIDETPEKQNTTINNVPVLGDFTWFESNLQNEIWVVCAIGNPKDKFSIVNRLSTYHLNYATLIHPSVKVNDFMNLGLGSIICCNSIISVNTKIGNHVCINPNCGIGHDTIIEDFSSLYWNVTLSGNVHIQEGCELGSKSVVIPKKTVGNWSIVGAGAVVVKDIPEQCVAVGIPAKPIKFLEL